MIKVKGSKMVFTGKDNTTIRKYAKVYGMSAQDFVIGTLWMMIMTKKREELKSQGRI